MTKLLSEKEELDGLVTDAESAKSTYESDYNKYLRIRRAICSI